MFRPLLRRPAPFFQDDRPVLNKVSYTTGLTVGPSAPLLLRTTAHPGLDRSRDQRPSSPISSTLAAPPPHMRAFAPFWDTIPADIKRQMLQVPFHDVEQSVEDAKAEAAARATRASGRRAPQDSRHPGRQKEQPYRGSPRHEESPLDPGKGDSRVQNSNGRARGAGTFRGRRGKRVFPDTPLIHRGLPD